MVLSIIVAGFVAASASLLGSFAILKRMALVGDALSHVALPGMAIGLMIGINPFVGAVAFLAFAVIGVWAIEHTSPLSLETVVGVFFTTSLAIGALIMPEHELVEALFGNITALSAAEAAVSIAFSVFLLVLLLVIYRQLALSMVSSEMARSIGVNNKRLDLIFLLGFALAVALGIRFVGALLMGSLVIIPAASAKNSARTLKSFMVQSVVYGVIAAMAGVYLALRYSLSPGPIFILISSTIFVITFAARQVVRP